MWDNLLDKERGIIGKNWPFLYTGNCMNIHAVYVQYIGKLVKTKLSLRILRVFFVNHPKSFLILKGSVVDPDPDQNWIRIQQPNP